MSEPKNHYRVIAKKMTSTECVTIAQHDGARMPKGNVNFIPEPSFVPERAKAWKEDQARVCVESVPFTIVANEHDNGVSQFGRPYIPATSFRGTLRGLSVSIMLDGISNLSHGVVSVLACGGKIENKESKKRAEAKNGGKLPAPVMTLDKFRNRDLGIPHFALYGVNNPAFLKGFDSFGMLLSEGHFYLTPGGIVRKNPYMSNPLLLGKLSVEGYDDACEEASIETEGVLAKNEAQTKATAARAVYNKLRKDNAPQSEVDEAKRIFDELSKEAKNADENREVSTGQLHQKWYIPVGVNFSWSMSHRMTDAELGLLILTFEKFAQNPILGGDTGRGGGGKFDFDFEISQYDQQKKSYVPIGNVTNEKYSDSLQVFVDEFQKNIPQYHQILSKLKA